MKTSYRYTLPLQVKNHWLIRYKCSIPAFNGLFLEEDNRSISKLLFLLATWHTYTKLCLHTETTVGMLDQVCKALCQALRHFTTVTCWASVYNEGAPTRSKAMCHMPTNPGNGWLHQAQKYHKQLQDRQDEAVQYVNIQDALYCWLPRCNSEVQDNRLVQYTCGMSCCLNTEITSDSCRASLHTTYPSCGMSYPAETTTCEMDCW